jgi:hypothetical protein
MCYEKRVSLILLLDFKFKVGEIILSMNEYQKSRVYGFIVAILGGFLFWIGFTSYPIFEIMRMAALILGVFFICFGISNLFFPMSESERLAKYVNFEQALKGYPKPQKVATIIGLGISFLVFIWRIYIILK